MATKDTEAIVNVTEPEAAVPMPAAETPQPQPVLIVVTEIEPVEGEVTDPQPIVTEPVENGHSEPEPTQAKKHVEVTEVKEEEPGTSKVPGEYCNE